MFNENELSLIRESKPIFALKEYRDRTGASLTDAYAVLVAEPAYHAYRAAIGVREAMDVADRALAEKIIDAAKARYENTDVEKIIDAAKARYENTDVEIDVDFDKIGRCVLSRENKGYWVPAHVWVPTTDLPRHRDTDRTRNQ